MVAAMRDNLLRGGAFMLLASVLFSVSDTIAKYVTSSVPVIELATIRYGVFVLMAASPLLRRRRISFRSRRPLLQVLRGVGVVGSALAFVASLQTLPVADATAINFITPLLITVLAIPVLGETVRPLGWVAVMVGFVGVLIVVRPGLGNWQPAVGLVLVSSLCWCTAMLITRRLVGVDRSSVTLLWTAGTGFALLLCALPLFLAPLTLREALLCIAVGLVASAGQWMAVLAYRYARATVLAPLTYAQLIWSSVLGYLVFDRAPDNWVLVGAAVIAASGLAVVQLERIRVAALRAGVPSPTALPTAVP